MRCYFDFLFIRNNSNSVWSPPGSRADYRGQ